MMRRWGYVNRRIKYGIGLCALLIGCLFLQGCGKSISTTSQENQPEVREYSKTVTDLHITPDYVPDEYFMDMTDSHCYFGQETITEREEELSYSCKFYFQTLDGKGEPTFILEVTEWVLAFRLSKASYGEDILSILTLEGEKCVLSEYDGEGKLTKQFDITDEGFVRSYASEMIRCQDGSYVGYNANTLYVFEEGGNVLNTVECPGAGFCNGMLAKDGTVYVMYTGKESSEDYLAEVNVKTGNLSDKVTLPPYSKSICETEEGKLLVLDDTALYSLSISSSEKEKILDLAIYNLFSTRVHDMDFQEGSLRLLTWDAGNGNAAICLENLSPKTEDQITNEKAIENTEVEQGKYDESGKRIIRLYDPYEMCLKDAISDFNMNNEQYTVVLEEDHDNYESVLLSENSPDLIINMMGYEVEKYRQNGYLEDLTPYIQASNKFSVEDLQESVIQYFSVENKLYALPKYYSFETLRCFESQIGDKTGWNVGEFLSWLENHSDVKSELGLEKSSILSFCLKGDMESYVDFEKGIADFNNPEFKDMLARIKGLECDTEFYYYSVYGDCDTEGTHLFESYLSNLNQISEIEYLFNDKLVNMGLPNASGKGKTLLLCTANISILSRSECKEGAFAFIEHYLTYDAQARYIEPTYYGTFWTLKSRWDKELEYLDVFSFPILDSDGNTRKIEYPKTQEQVDMVFAMIENAEMDTYENDLIRCIIQEEVQPYFQGQKDLDTVCDIIQSRVSILLSERR